MQDLNPIIGEFLHGFVHEISTPLTTLLLQPRSSPSDQSGAVHFSAQWIDDVVAMSAYIFCSAKPSEGPPNRTSATLEEIGATTFAELADFAQLAQVQLLSTAPNAEVLWNPQLTGLAIRALTRFGIGAASDGGSIELSKPDSRNESFKIEIRYGQNFAETFSHGHRGGSLRFRHSLVTRYCETLASQYGEEFRNSMTSTACTFVWKGMAMRGDS